MRHYLHGTSLKCSLLARSPNWSFTISLSYKKEEKSINSRINSVLWVDPLENPHHLRGFLKILAGAKYTAGGALTALPTFTTTETLATRIAFVDPAGSGLFDLFGLKITYSEI